MTLLAKRCLAIAWALVGLSTAHAQSPRVSSFADRPTAEQLAFFEKKIRPALVEHCYKCHSSETDRPKGEFLLDTREGIRQGGATGPAIVAGNAERSHLIRVLRSNDQDTAMPPKGKLPDQVIADFETWVKMGAPDPRDGKVVVATPKSVVDIEKGRSFWAFVPPKKSEIPTIDPAVFAVSTPIDAFLAAGWAKKGLKPVGDADKRTLLRRVYLDLTGLPPTSEAIEAFVNDHSANAFETVVDQLLASPAFGERWGRHWLDVARYAESSGKAVNVNYPHAWRYRDYVIDSFNSDKPYDLFVKEQLAGDLMRGGDAKTKAERTVATGFLAIGPKSLNERNAVQFELDLVDEQIDVTFQAFLGITAACARCHDHKFDPIPQSDYYSLAGIFRSSETCYGTVRQIQSQRPSPTIELPRESGLPAHSQSKLSSAERKRIEEQIKDLQKSEQDDILRRLITQAQIAQLRSKLDSYDADGNLKLLAMGVRDKPAPRGGVFAQRFGQRPGGQRPGMFGGYFGGTTTISDSPIYKRGEPDQPSEERVPRGTLQVMSQKPLKIPAGTSGRLQLAEWIVSHENPLTARVMVNRAWLHLFGRGLVPTADNFGSAGLPPTHPELLDYLAVTFMEDDAWSVKKLIKRIVMSHAYRLDSKYEPSAHERDPENAFVWRMSPRRLDAESLRDSILAVSGQLDAKHPVGSVVAQAGEGQSAVFARLGGANIQQAINDPRNTQRSVYLPIIRDSLPEALALFDAPDASLIAADRPTTTVPSQGLFILNNPFVIRSAEAAAEKLLPLSSDSERIREAYRGFFGRNPTNAEIANAEKFLDQYRRQLVKDRVPAFRRERESWASFCQALFASAEFQYRR